jgi:signal transduction histidine kinase/streptogramin lyase
MNYRHQEADPGGLCSDEVNALLEDRSGNLWVGTTTGLDRLDRQRASFQHIVVPGRGPPGPFSISGRCVYALLEDRDGNLWVATNSGLSRRDPHTGAFSHYLHRGEMDALGFFVGAILQPVCWTDGSLLLGSKGLYRFFPSTGRLQRYQHAPDLPESHVGHLVHGMTEDQEGNLWIGTFSGAYVLGRDGSFRRFSAPGELPSNLICQIVRGEGTDLWLSTADAGLVRYIADRDTFRVYETKEGFLRNVYCYRGGYHADDGRVYFGSLNGFCTFHPCEVRDNHRVPLLHITDIQLFGRTLPRERLAEDPAILVLSHTENMLTFGFVGLSYTDPEKLRYAYRLEGFDETWLDCGTRRSATFTNLDPGDYVFRVKASNSDGVWNETGASFAFLIDPPFWGTWWFRGVLALLLGMSLYGMHRYRIGRILALERLRLRIANDLHDDIGSDLSSIALESDLLARRIPFAEPAAERFRAVGHAIRRAADNLRDVVWIVSPDQDRMEDLVARLREVTEKMLTVIPFTFTCGEEMNPGSLDMEFKRHVFMMFKEILHNIVRHAAASHVEIRCDIERKRLRLCVRDNGCGFDPAVKHGGRGLHSLQSRASTIGGKLSIQSAPHKGTEICLEADIARL